MQFGPVIAKKKRFGGKKARAIIIIALIIAAVSLLGLAAMLQTNKVSAPQLNWRALSAEASKGAGY